jgi:hypothetical protein
MGGVPSWRRVQEKGITPSRSGSAEDEPNLGLPEEDDLASAAADPLTSRAFAMMQKHPISAKDLSEDVGEPTEEVAGHLLDLRRSGLIQVAEHREVDGRSEPFYQGPYIPLLDKEEREELEPEQKQFHLEQIIELLKRDLQLALEEETLDAWPDFQLCRIPFRMDPQGWEELRVVYEDALASAMRIRREATKRLRQDGSKGKRGVAAQALFELPDFD